MDECERMRSTWAPALAFESNARAWIVALTLAPAECVHITQIGAYDDFDPSKRKAEKRFDR